MYFCIGWLLVLLLPALACAQGVSYSAIVLDISGKVTVGRQGNQRLLELGGLLYPQEVVETALGSSLTINYLESGEEEQWPGDLKFIVGQARSDHLHPHCQRMNRKVALPSLAFPPGGAKMVDMPEEGPPGGLKLRGGPQELEPQTLEVGDLPSRAAPADRSGERSQEGALPYMGVKGLANSATLEDRPRFSWGAVSGADLYRVALYPPGGNQPLWQRTSPETALPFPQGEPALTWGRRYVWEVEARRDGKVIAKRRSCFSLPGEKEIAPLTEQKKRFAGQLASRPGDTPTRLAFIFFLEDHHLYDEAAAQYSVLRAGGKDSEPLRDREARLMQMRFAPCSLTP